jgi:hypothetical protein
MRLAITLAITLAAALTLTPRNHAAAPPQPDQPARFHVATSGRSGADGSRDNPFPSLDQARDAIRALRQNNRLPAAGAEVWIHPGLYPVSQPFRLEAQDSGTPAAPIVYRAADTSAPRFHGGRQLASFKKVSDPAVLQRLPESARPHVVECDLAAEGIPDPPPWIRGGFASGRGFQTHPAPELFVNDLPMTVARWPNLDFVKTGEVPGPLTLTAWDRRPGSPEGRFRFEGDRPLRWRDEPDAWLYGYWFWDWADSYEKIESIHPETREITLAKPWHRYGYRKNQRFHAINLLSELDQPDEWYLDRQRRKLYWYPAVDPAKARVELSLTTSPLLELAGVSHVRFQGILWECGAADGVHIRDGSHTVLEGCTVRKMAGNAIDIRGGSHHQVRSCDLHTLGRGGIAMSGGDRHALTPGSHRIENCHIHHLSRIDHTYTPGVWLDGVGQTLRHNLIHHVASSAMRIEGNDHLVERNEAHRVVLESDDQGAVDMFGNPTYRGNVFRHNYWHHLGAWDGTGDTSHGQRAGIRLDDAICGVLVEGNIFQRCSTGRTHFGGVQIHGGKENLVVSNLFIDTAAAVSFTPWGDARWRTFVAQALETPAIQRERYLQRYPTLASLPDHHDANTVRHNVAIRCQEFLLRSPPVTTSEANRILPDETAFREGPDGRLIWSDSDAARLGLGSIPFHHIGLHEDAWRLRQGTNWVLRGAPR